LSDKLELAYKTALSNSNTVVPIEMKPWPSPFSRKSDPKASTILWDSTVFFFALGLPILIVLALVDPTEVNSEPRWLKPIKFFVSIGIYNLTLEWIYRLFGNLNNLRRFNVVRWIVSVGMLIEGVLIALQAARGVQGHFNVATPLDDTIYGIMGISITIVVLSVLWSGWIVFRAREQAPKIVNEAVLLGSLS
jgi:hypothetical protein